MSHLTDLDIPVLTSAGFKAGWSGHSWFAKDKNGDEWQAYTTDDTNKLTFSNRNGSQFMKRSEFDQLFGV